MQHIGERQRRVWLVSGASAVTAAVLCGLNWFCVLLGGGVASLYYYYIDTRLGTDGLADRFGVGFGFVGKVLCVFFLFWNILAMGWCANLADLAFPSVDGFPGLGWVLLALTAWGIRKGTRACAGCSGILSLFLLVLYGAVVVFSVPDVKKEYLVPSPAWGQAAKALGLLLLPAGAWCVPVREKKNKGQLLYLLLPVASAALAAVTAGVLSPELAAESPVPLYTLSQSVSVFGVIERIEPLLSAAIIMGVYCLLSSLAAACQALSDQIGSWSWSGSLCCLGAAAAMYPVREVPEALILGGNFVFFLLLPLVVCAFTKKSEISQKSVDKDLGR